MSASFLLFLVREKASVPFPAFQHCVFPMNDGFFFTLPLVSIITSLLRRSTIDPDWNWFPNGSWPICCICCLFPPFLFLLDCSFFWLLFTFSFLPFFSRIAHNNPWHLPPFLLLSTLWHCDLTYLTMLRASFCPFLIPVDSLPCHALNFLVVFPLSQSPPAFSNAFCRRLLVIMPPCIPSSPQHSPPVSVSNALLPCPAKGLN